MPEEIKNLKLREDDLVFFAHEHPEFIMTKNFGQKLAQVKVRTVTNSIYT